MSQFIHEIIPDPINGDREMVTVNNLELPLAEFQKLEPDYKALPEGMKGFQYISGKHYYAYDMDGNVIQPTVSESTLEACLANVSSYNDAMVRANKVKLIQQWDTGSIDKNRTKRIKEIKNEARLKLADETDWYFVRKTEKGSPIPQSILDYREAIRKSVDDAKKIINSLSNVQAIKNASINWPTNPDDV